MGSMITANYDSETDQIIDASPRLNNGVANSSVPVTASPSGSGVAKLISGTETLMPRRRVLDAIDSAIAANQSACISVQVDSTGNGPTEWVYMLGQALAAKWSEACVIYRLWNDANQNFDAPQVIQQGLLGERFAQFIANCRSFFMPASSMTPVTGDIDVRVKVSLEQWQRGATQTLVARYGAAPNRSWKLEMNSSNRLSFAWSADGSTDAATVTSGAALAFADGETGWVRAVLDIDNGANGRTCTLYTSSDGYTWASVGTSNTTSGGATSIYNPAGQEYEIGGRGQNGGVILGKIYAVEIRDGIDGGISNPQPLESWCPRGVSGSYIPGTFGGSPTVYIWNGAQSGAAYNYFSDAVRFPKMVPAMAGGVAYQSCSLNDDSLVGPAYWSVRDSWLTQIKARAPSSVIAVLNQNPRTAPDLDHTIEYHARRAVEMVSWAQRNGLPIVDSYRDFVTDPRGYTTLLEPADGKHPTQGLDGGQGVLLRAVWQS